MRGVSADELWPTFLNAITLMPKVYCRVNALYEMDVAKLDLNHLVELGMHQYSTAKLLAVIYIQIELA